MTKHWAKSKAVWGSIISLVSFIIVFFVSKTASDKYFAVSGALSSLLSLYGRITAKHTLTTGRNKDG